MSKMGAQYDDDLFALIRRCSRPQVLSLVQTTIHICFRFVPHSELLSVEPGEMKSICHASTAFWLADCGKAQNRLQGAPA
mmetsp:Transcript_103194/g.166376  ORF Transcript_103194/g.166376 Transcript_103194/m.166376 type:complete len:80 (+) Transcript_103194:580-819(+)